MQGGHGSIRAVIMLKGFCKKIVMQAICSIRGRESRTQGTTASVCVARCKTAIPTVLSNFQD